MGAAVKVAAKPVLLVAVTQSLSCHPVQPAMRGCKRRRHIGQQGVESPRSGACPRDQNIVMPPPAQKGQKLRRGGAQAALGTVAGDGIADLAAGGETDAPGSLRRGAIWGLAGFQ